MSELPDRRALLDEARARLESARAGDDASRANLLEDLYVALEQELDADEAAPPGR
jgi:hypothetical protein